MAAPTDDDAVVLAAGLVTDVLRADGALFLAGNGGSFADALHIAGELAKSFERERPLSPQLRTRIADLAGTDELGVSLQRGVRVFVLGTNPVLTSAVDNDIAARHLGFAQELCALARPGDAFLALSTSGRSRNLLNAAYVARALDLRIVVLAGPDARDLGAVADAVVNASGATTAEIQTNQVAQYHALCRLIEQDALTS